MPDRFIITNGYYDNAMLANSSDGITWTTNPSSSQAGSARFAHNGTVWVTANGSGYHGGYSVDGIYFEQTTVLGQGSGDAVLYDGTQFILLPSVWYAQRQVAVSADGKVWTRKLGIDANAFTCIAYSETLGIYVAGTAEQIYTSNDLVTWVKRHGADLPWPDPNSGTRDIFRSIVWNGSLFVAVTTPYSGSDKTIYTSPDGRVWTQRVDPLTTKGLFEVVWTGLSFIAVGSGGIIRSVNGIDWTIVRASATGVYGVAGGNGVILASGSSPSVGVLRSLDDGMSWVAYPLPAADFPGGALDIAFGPGGSYTHPWEVSTLAGVYENRALASVDGTGTTAVVHPYRMHAGSDNNIYFVERSSYNYQTELSIGDQVRKCSPEGVVTTITQDTFVWNPEWLEYDRNESLYQPEGVVLYDDALYVLAYGGPSGNTAPGIWRVAMNGVITPVMGGRSFPAYPASTPNHAVAGTGTAAHASYNATGLVLGPDGMFWFVDLVSNYPNPVVWGIWKCTSSGTLSLVTGGLKFMPTIAVGPDRTLYVASYRTETQHANNELTPNIMKSSSPYTSFTPTLLVDSWYDDLVFAGDRLFGQDGGNNLDDLTHGPTTKVITARQFGTDVTEIERYKSGAAWWSPVDQALAAADQYTLYTGHPDRGVIRRFVHARPPVAPEPLPVELRSGATEMRVRSGGLNIRVNRG